LGCSGRERKRERAREGKLWFLSLECTDAVSLSRYLPVVDVFVMLCCVLCLSLHLVFYPKTSVGRKSDDELAVTGQIFSLSFLHKKIIKFYIFTQQFNEFFQRVANES